MSAYQQAVREWVLHTFGKDVADDIPTRCFRFFEEAGELCQSLGMTKEDAIKLVEYTWGRPAGEPVQEVGGVMVTLAAMLTPVSIDMEQAGWVELGRCWQNVDKIRAKQKSKAAIGLGADPIPGFSEKGMYVTMTMAYNAVVQGFGWFPQGSVWLIVGCSPDDWHVTCIKMPGHAEPVSGTFSLHKSYFSLPRKYA